MKKKLFLFAALLLAVSPLLFGQEEEGVWWGSRYLPGNVGFSARAGLEALPGYSTGIGLYPGAEIIISKPSLGIIAPFDIGAAVRGHIGLGMDSSLENALTAGVGGFVTFHLGLRGLADLDTDLLDGADIFSEAGLYYDILPLGSGQPVFGLAVASGLRYFFTDALSLSVGYHQWGDLSGGFIGGQLTLGGSPTITEGKIEEARVSISEMSHQMYLSQFYAIYWYAFAAGGFYFGDDNYAVGQGTVWEISSSTAGDEEDTLRVEKALLAEEPDGSRWWAAAFTSEGDRYLYEYLESADHELVKMRYRGIEEGRVGSYTFTAEERSRFMIPNRVTPEDYEQMAQGTEEITVPAGSFQTRRLGIDAGSGEEEVSYDWWISEEVPGRLVKFEWRTGEDWARGELVEITSGNSPQLGSMK